mgnify:CR=1 FL=1
MSKQDEILGKHPAEHPCLGVWLDYEDKEGTDTSWIRCYQKKLPLTSKLMIGLPTNYWNITICQEQSAL